MRLKITYEITPEFARQAARTIRRVRRAIWRYCGWMGSPLLLTGMWMLLGCIGGIEQGTMSLSKGAGWALVWGGVLILGALLMAQGVRENNRRNRVGRKDF